MEWGCQKLFLSLPFIALTYQNVVCQILEIGFHFARVDTEKVRKSEQRISRVHYRYSTAYYKPNRALQDALRILKIAAEHVVCNKNECDFSSFHSMFSLAIDFFPNKNIIDKFPNSVVNSSLSFKKNSIFYVNEQFEAKHNKKRKQSNFIEWPGHARFAHDKKGRERER